MKQMINMGQSVENFDIEPPVLEMGLSIYLAAFYNLDRGRNHYFGPTAIAWRDVEYYAERNNFSERQTNELHFFIGEMDRYELERVAKEQKNKPKS